MRIVACSYKSVREVGFTPDARTLVALGHLSTPGRCEWHDLAGDRPPRVHTLSSISWNGFAVSPHDGTVLIGDATELLEFPPAGGEVIRHAYPDNRLWKVAVSPDGRRLACAADGISFGRNRVPIRLSGHTRTGKGWKQAWKFDGTGTRFGQPVFLPDGKRIAVLQSGGKKVKGRFEPRATLSVLSTQGKLLHERSYAGAFLDLAVCGEHLVLGDSHLLRVLPLADLDAEPVLVSLGNKHLYALCGDPLGRFLLAGCGKQVLEFDPASWKPARQFDWKIGTVACLAVSADGTVAAAGGDKGKVAVWDVG